MTRGCAARLRSRPSTRRTTELIQLGPEIEVHEPEVLRSRLAETAAAMATLYESSGISSSGLS